MNVLLREKWWWYSLLFILVIQCLVHQTLFEQMEKNQTVQTFEELRDKAAIAKILLDRLPIESGRGFDIQSMALQMKLQVGVRVTFIDTTGRVIADSDVDRAEVSKLENHLNRPEIQQAISEGYGHSYRTSGTVKHKLFYAAIPVEKKSVFKGFLRLAYYSERITAALTKTKILFFISLIISSILLWIVAGTLIYKLMTPWDKIAQYSFDILAERVNRLPEEKWFGKSELVRNALQGLLTRLSHQSARLRDERQFFQHSIDVLDDAVAIIDQDMVIRISNRKFKNDFNREEKSTECINIIQLIHSPELSDALNRSQTRQEVCLFELEYPIQDEKRFLRGIIHPIPYQKVNWYLVFFHDNTEIKKLQAIRRDFVANVSHEMKTPLASLTGYLETLISHPEISPEKQKNYLQRSLIQAHKMQSLVSDLLKLSELEQGKQVEMSVFSLNQLINKVLLAYQDEIKAKSIAISTELHQTGIQVYGDRKKIEVVLSNLIQNAIHYTPEKGNIRISTEKKPDSRVKVSIQDNGIGIDPKFHERIFQRFYRVDQVRDMHSTGTGLGLAIVKRIIHAHNEQIGLESAPGKGSTFWFTLKAG